MTAPSAPDSLEKGVRLFQGEGVSGVVYERMSAFFTFAALTPPPLSLREQCLSQRDKHCSRSERGARSFNCQQPLVAEGVARAHDEVLRAGDAA